MDGNGSSVINIHRLFHRYLNLHPLFASDLMPRRRARDPPSTPDWVPLPPDGATVKRYYVAGDYVYFYNVETGVWQTGLIVDIPGVSGSTLRPFLRKLAKPLKLAWNL